MVLFPIALLWVAGVLFWIIRKSLNEPEDQPEQPHRFRPRSPNPGHRPERSPSSRSARKRTTKL
jgi:hypothetical protein